jgi:hypothetical protein
MRIAGVVLAGAVAAVTLTPAAGFGAATKAKSTTSILSCCSKSSSGKYGVVASLQPEHPNSRMTFAAFKMQSGSFVKYASKSVAAQSSGNGSTIFTTSLKPSNKNVCKITAKFGGDADHKPSSDSIKFMCKTGQPI